MNTQKFSEAMNEIDNRYLEEAVHYKKKAKKYSRIKWGAAAACLIVMLVLGSILLLLNKSAVVSAHTYGSGEEITSAGAVIHTGTINDDGVMTGSPLMFYLSGKNIAAIRFSCKNQMINFMDWTEKREEYGNAQNFTVSYGEDESEYYYLTINWVPDTTIRELTDHKEITIEKLPEELREDIIVMEITFHSGKTATKAIHIRLLGDGTFFASFGDYKITGEDDFLSRPDSPAIPRDILLSPEGSLNPDSQIPAPETGGGNSSAVTKDDESTPSVPENREDAAAAEASARAYYSGTVFTIESMEPISRTENEIMFSVCVSKEGIVQEPNRTISLQRKDSVWKVINEGY